MNRHFAVSLGVIAMLIGGCGGPDRPPMGRVSGVVSYNGAPLDSGEVKFIPIQGAESDRPAIGVIESDGSYKLTTFNTGDGAVVGQHKVLVTVPRPVETMGENVDEESGMMPSFDQPMPEYDDVSGIPSKYGNLDSTPLRYTVEQSGNTIDIELED